MIKTNGLCLSCKKINDWNRIQQQLTGIYTMTGWQLKFALDIYSKMIELIKPIHLLQAFQIDIKEHIPTTEIVQRQGISSYITPCFWQHTGYLCQRLRYKANRVTD